MKLIPIILLVVLVGSGVYFLGKNQKSSTQLNYSPYSSPIPSPTTITPNLEGTENWKTYQNNSLGIIFKYPPYYVVMEEKSDDIKLGLVQIKGVQPLPVLDITKGKLTDTSSYLVCTEKSSFPCLNGKGAWEQSENTISTKLDARNAKSIYYALGNDTQYHIIQTTESPFFELKMFVSGGGLDPTFKQMLSTFKFTK